jgi:Uroporphyrinogen-III decarboxylase
VAVDETVDLSFAKDRLQPHATVQGNLDPGLLIEGGEPMRAAARRIVEVLGDGPFIFNLGHGVTPDVDPAHVADLVATVREASKA